eukprot:CAMPEP_0205868840 /NCGR_PEP_ID=MMETSP1083-20121108/9696_1 /ASSEMBLY_ACC=CAM_ASM_000430 /TAXON_ID=97485 /ORGANISM="Prymnesium parvum, Strain Texoma1" /LENGTH=57 /DNA_ID=CAMNT_0053230995 /DNA_START=665 /DNA_END=835 /DNA_ORIENTATION=+
MERGSCGAGVSSAVDGACSREEESGAARRWGEAMTTDQVVRLQEWNLSSRTTSGKKE